MIKFNHTKIRPLCPKHRDIRMDIWECLTALCIGVTAEFFFFVYLIIGDSRTTVLFLIIMLVAFFLSMPHMKTALKHGGSKSAIIDSCNNCYDLNNPDIPDYI